MITLTKNITISFLFVFMTAGCIQEVSKKSIDKPESKPIELIGKTIAYTYGESVYHVTIDSDKEMHWEAVAGDEKGTYEEETYKMEYLNDSTVFITWGEANGIGVSQVLDFEKGIVHNHLLRGRDISIGKGKIEILSN